MSAAGEEESTAVQSATAESVASPTSEQASDLSQSHRQQHAEASDPASASVGKQKENGVAVTPATDGGADGESTAEIKVNGADPTQHAEDEQRSDVAPDNDAHAAPSTPSKVHAIERPADSRQPQPPQTSMLPPPVPGQQSSSTGLRPETLQHKHSGSMADKPSSYQPTPPATYMQLKALALQLPSRSSHSSSNSSHVDPPTLILEGRTNLSTARRSFYARVTRTLPELQLWCLALTLSFPAGIFSPFSYPPPSLVAGGNAEDASIRAYLTTVTNQLARILRKPYVLSHPATVALVDCDFSYTPGLPHVGPGSSASARRKLEEGVSLARQGHDPLRGRKGKGPGAQGGGGVSATATWDVDGVAAALGLPALPSQQASADTYGAPSSSSSSSKNPLSIFSRASASPQRIQPHPPVPIPPGEEDQDEEELTAARNEITRLELQFEKASLAAHVLVERNSAMTATVHQLSVALNDLARMDEGRTIARRARESEEITTLTKGLEAWSAAQAGANAALMGTIVPSMTYQSLNARAAIDALLRRAAAATHRHSALVVLVQKRREAERLKRARGEIRQEDVDWVLQELRDAQRTTQVLTHHLTTFTNTLKEELKAHSRNTHADIQDALLHHARTSMRAHRVVLSNLTRARDGLVALREGRPVGEMTIPSLNPPIRSAAAEKRQDAAEESRKNTEGQRADAAPSANGTDENTTKAKAKDTSHSGQHSTDSAVPVSTGSATPSLNKDLPRAPSEESPTEAPESRAAQPESVEQGPTPSQSQSKEPMAPSPPPFGTQSAIMPPRRVSSMESASADAAAPRPASPPQSAAVPSMSQSVFLPGRDMSRYANPFARMDGGAGAAFPSTAASRNPFTPSAAQINGPSQVQPGSGGGGGGAAPPTAAPGAVRPPANDVWANRSRMSASDAARSLGGRF